MTTGSPEPTGEADKDVPSDTRPASGLTGGQIRLGGAIAVLILIVLLSIAFCLGRLYEVPGPLEFWKVTAQPLGVVTAGLLAVIAAVVTFTAYRRTSDSAAESARLQREKEIKAEALDRCWERFRFVFENSEVGENKESRGVAFPPDVTFELAGILVEEAAVLKDLVLVQFIAQWAEYYTTVHVLSPVTPSVNEV